MGHRHRRRIQQGAADERTRCRTAPAAARAVPPPAAPAAPHARRRSAHPAPARGCRGHRKGLHRRRPAQRHGPLVEQLQRPGFRQDSIPRCCRPRAGRAAAAPPRRRRRPSAAPRPGHRPGRRGRRRRAPAPPRGCRAGRASPADAGGQQAEPAQDHAERRPALHRPAAELVHHAKFAEIQRRQAEAEHRRPRRRAAQPGPAPGRARCHHGTTTCSIRSRAAACPLGFLQDHPPGPADHHPPAVSDQRRQPRIQPQWGTPEPPAASSRGGWNSSISKKPCSQKPGSGGRSGISPG